MGVDCVMEESFVDDENAWWFVTRHLAWHPARKTNRQIIIVIATASSRRRERKMHMEVKEKHAFPTAQDL